MPQPQPFDLLRVAGLRPKKNPVPRKYASFNHRMIAATIDSMILLSFVAPVLDALLSVYVPPIPINHERMDEIANTYPSGFPAMGAIWSELVSSGVVGRHMLTLFIQTLVLFIYTGVCWHYWAATPGKMIMRLRVADAVTEAPITDRQILLRIAGYFVSAFPFLFGFMAISFSRTRQGWHDRMAGTVVLAKPIPWSQIWEELKTGYASLTGTAKPGSPTGNPSGSPAPKAAE